MPVGRAGGLLIRAKCAPHFRRVLYELDPGSPLLANYAHGSCPAGKYYCRITPTGDVTPCPYMPVAAGNLRETGFAELWERSQVFTDLRTGPLGGRCGACEFREICGGCRCRAYATYGDYLAEDPACGYQPGAHGGELIRLGVEQTFGLEVRFALAWEPAARARLDAIPAFARAMVVQAVEAYARGQGQATVTPALLAEVRSRWGISPGRPFTPATGRPPVAGAAEPAMASRDARYRQAAWTYVAYGVVYWLGGLGARQPPGSVPRGMERGRHGMVRRRRPVRRRLPVAPDPEAAVVRPLGPLAAGLRARPDAPGRDPRDRGGTDRPGCPAPRRCPSSGSTCPCARARGPSASSRSSRPLMLARAAWSREP